MITDAIKKILHNAKAKKASDVHICAGAPILCRIGKDLVPISDRPLSSEVSRRLSYELLLPEQIAQFEKLLDYDLMLTDEEGRYRVNVNYNDGNVGAILRILPGAPKTIEELHLPPVVRELSYRTKGLVLITGSTSQGKTTTLSAMIHEINRRFRRHIITIEDPIEYMQINDQSVIRQRGVGKDTKSFSSGLRAALRQDPDVIAIGEMRDYDTIKIALTAAETGVLVLSTLHVISIDKMIERVLSYGLASDENSLRYSLADSLQGVVHQELLPTLDGGKRVACEVLVTTDAVRNLIRKGTGYHLRTIMSTGGKFGMTTMKQSVEELLDEGLISEEVARGALMNYGG
ncbi:MAG: PilT/PilU family type 4a pilus ATPase [Planctomycetaceae bacterium]|nr:PilT/PilU family type 4a pilus ATPase [Planctomycetaceae bacterium]